MKERGGDLSGRCWTALLSGRGWRPAEGCDLAARLLRGGGPGLQPCMSRRTGRYGRCFPQTAEGKLSGPPRPAAGHRPGSRPPPRRGASAFLWRGDGGRGPDLSPPGTVCMTAGLIRFETARRRRFIAGRGVLTVDVPAQAADAGQCGQCGRQGAVTAMAAAPVGIAACTNPAPFAGGGDEEGDEGLRQRVLRHLPAAAQRGQRRILSSRGPSPLTRWPRRPYCPGAGAGVRWTWWRPPWRGCRTRSCWAS